MSHYPTVEQVERESRKVELVYSVLARIYDAFFDWALGPGRREAIRRIPMRPGDRVLEVGVGTGLSLPCYPRDCRVTGIDISEPMLEKARIRARELGLEEVELRRMDARNLRFPDGYFQHVFAPYVVSVVPDPDRLMAEATRVCAPGGTVTVVNHFMSRNRLGARLEKIITPLSCWIGFRMDLPVEAVTRTPGLEVQRVDPVNLLGMWRLVEMRREG